MCGGWRCGGNAPVVKMKNDRRTGPLTFNKRSPAQIWTNTQTPSLSYQFCNWELGTGTWTHLFFFENKNEYLNLTFYCKILIKQ
jgi:hypothetical protein